MTITEEGLKKTLAIYGPRATIGGTMLLFEPFIFAGFLLFADSQTKDNLTPDAVSDALAWGVFIVCLLCVPFPRIVRKMLLDRPAPARPVNAQEEPAPANPEAARFILASMYAAMIGHIPGIGALILGFYAIGKTGSVLGGGPNCTPIIFFLLALSFLLILRVAPTPARLEQYLRQKHNLPAAGDADTALPRTDDSQSKL